MELKEMCKYVRKQIGGGMSQLEFARRIGTNQTKISLIERGYVLHERDREIAKAIKAAYRRVKIASFVFGDLLGSQKKKATFER